MRNTNIIAYIRYTISFEALILLAQTATKSLTELFRELFKTEHFCITQPNRHRQINRKVETQRLRHGNI